MQYNLEHKKPQIGITIILENREKKRLDPLYRMADNKDMYIFKNRFIFGAVIPAIFLLVYIGLHLFEYLKSDTPPFTEADLIYQLVSGIGIMLIGYLASVLFFSVETIIRLVVRDKVSINAVMQRAQKRSFGKNLEILEKWDTSEDYKISNSVIFQGILLVVALYAGMAGSALVGKVMVLSIIFQMLAAQGIRIAKGSDISLWYWQVSYPVKRDTQVMIFLLMSIFFVFIVATNMGI